MSGALVLVTASSVEPVSRSEAKAWLRVEDTSTYTAEDSLIDAIVTRARQRFEDVTKRSCLVQTFDYYLDEMPDHGAAVALPKAPLVSVVSIRGFSSTESTDSGGTAMTTTDWYVNTAREFGEVMPVSGAVYPTATREVNPVIIRFTAGYSSGSSGVPEGVKAEIKQIVASLYEHRGDEQEQAGILEAYGGAEYALPTWG